MRVTRFQLLMIFVVICLIGLNNLFAQYAISTPTARRVGNHNGNQVRTTFTNYGVIGQPGSQGTNVAWKYDANGYATDIQPLVGVRLPIRDYRVAGVYDGVPDTLYSVVGCNADRSGVPDYDPGGGQFWGFEPIPGFFNENLDALGMGVAMSHLPQTWPDYWPDHPDWVDDEGKAEWNGYFGRGVMNADQESYFLMDDANDLKMWQRYHFLPDSNNPSRKGQGLQIAVRGMQWSNFLAQDVIFWVYEVTNVGTETYDQAAFGTLVGTYIGVGPSGGTEWMDDASFFNVREAIVYSWDFDQYINPSANPKWLPNPNEVGYIGYAFLESPGNPYDGIDNDGDNAAAGGTAPFFKESDFLPRKVKAGDKLVLIDKNTYERTVFVMPNKRTTVVSLGKKFTLIPDTTILEEGNMKLGGSKGLTLNPNAYDGLDNDLDGLIDENYQLHYRQYKETTGGVVLIDTLAPVQHFDYVTGAGLSDLMIDEARDDGIDNDGDWDPLTDDVGADGKPGTGDYGEGDGMPTNGEPHFDQKDVNESDQLGLTSFDYFVPSTDIDMSDENEMWERMRPGRFDVPESIVENRAIRGEDGDFIFGSGYFPLLPGKTQRFSLALVFGDDYESVVRSKNIAQLIYNSNYNFPKPPTKPTLTAVPGDGKVTLYWDKAAEKSYDYSLQEFDFEGYKIYKGTDPYFTDAKVISNGYGQVVDYKPIAQFDLDNSVSGFFNSDPLLYELSSAKPFYLGDNTGIQNSFVDTDVINGRTYYYAVCAYDRGDEAESIYPSENSKTIYRDAAGNMVFDKNTAAVTPSAPVAGYRPPQSGRAARRVEGFSSFVPSAEVIDPTKLKETTYIISFLDSLVQGVPIAYAYNVIDSASGDTIFWENTNLQEENGDVFDGIRFSFDTYYQELNNIRMDTTHSGWNNDRDDNLVPVVSEFKWKNIVSTRFPNDYLFVFSDERNRTSSRLPLIFGNNSPLKSVATNFDVFDVTDPSKPQKVQYGFVEYPGSKKDTLSHFDSVYLSNADGSALSWRITFTGKEAKTPQAGDSLLLSFFKPFSAKDKFVYQSKIPAVDPDLAKNEMDNIRAVPNPYIVTNVFEQPLPSQVRGRGERVINFINLPAKSVIKIFTSNGHHVRTLRHSGSLSNGTCTWDLRTKEGLDIATGVYFYVVEAPGIKRKKTGKLAIIK
ncbi:MAG: hypothetical protein GXO77_04245 [Calditrichaeota bacterium]|nr:hypothetical protein [Calditrichota bacterium]